MTIRRSPARLRDVLGRRGCPSCPRPRRSCSERPPRPAAASMTRSWRSSWGCRRGDRGSAPAGAQPADPGRCRTRSGSKVAGTSFHHALLAELAESELIHGERDRLHAAFASELERRGEVDGVDGRPRRARLPLGRGGRPRSSGARADRRGSRRGARLRVRRGTSPLRGCPRAVAGRSGWASEDRARSGRRPAACRRGGRLDRCVRSGCRTWSSGDRGRATSTTRSTAGPIPRGWARCTIGSAGTYGKPGDRAGAEAAVARPCA